MDAFSGKPHVVERYEEGAFVYIDRGRDHSKLRKANELRAETAMFGDYDDTMQEFEARQLYSPGFYVEYVHETNQHLVYAYDIEDVILMDPKKIRLVTDPVDKLKFQQDSAMTTVRELFFLREKRGTIPYPKFQVGILCG